MFFRFCYLFLLLLVNLFASSQNTAWQWAKGFGDTLYDWSTDICTDLNGNIYVVGAYNSPSIAIGSVTLFNAVSYQKSAMFIAKLDASGQTIWAKNIGTSSSQTPGSVITDTNGNIICTGYFGTPQLVIGTTTLTNSNSSANVQNEFLAKFDASGNSLWAINIGPATQNFDGGVAVDQNGKIFICGDYPPGTVQWGASSDFFVSAYDAAGNLLWKKTGGGASSDFCRGITVNSNGDVIITGSSGSPTLAIGTSTFSQSGLSGNIFLAKYSNAGTFLWARIITGLGDDRAEAVHADANGNILLTGQFTSSVLTLGSQTLTNTETTFLTPNFFLVKYDGSGTLLWARSASGYNKGKDLYADGNGNIILVGDFADTLSIGNQLTIGNGSSDLFLAKFDGSGNPLWLTGIGGSMYDEAVALCQGSQGELYVTGKYRSYDLTIGNTLLPKFSDSNRDDFFVAKLNSTIVGIEEQSSNGNFRLYPNPFAAELFIECAEVHNKLTISLYSVSGQLVRQESRLSGTSFSVSAEGLSPGIYFLKLSENERLLQVQKVVVSD